MTVKKKKEIPKVKIYRWQCHRCSEDHPCTYISLHEKKPRITCLKQHKLKKAHWRAAEIHDQSKLAKFMKAPILIGRDTLHRLDQNTRKITEVLKTIHLETDKIQSTDWETIKKKVQDFRGKLDMLLTPLQDRANEIKFLVDNINTDDKKLNPAPKPEPKKVNLRDLKFDNSIEATVD